MSAQVGAYFGLISTAVAPEFTRNFQELPEFDMPVIVKATIIGASASASLLDHRQGEAYSQFGASMVCLKWSLFTCSDSLLDIDSSVAHIFGISVTVAEGVSMCHMSASSILGQFDEKEFA